MALVADVLDPGEQLRRPDLLALQHRRLQALLARLADHPFWAPRLARAGLPGGGDATNGRRATSEGDDPAPLLAALGFTAKPDLWEHYPLGLLAVPREQVARIHATSGTRGRPTIVAYTAGDLEVFATVVARALRAAGAGAGTVVHNAYGYGLFTGGLGLHGGAERIAATVVPVSGGQTERQLMLMRDLAPEVLCCTPSYATLLGESAAAAGMAPADVSLRVGIFGAEPWSEAMRCRIEALLAITALDIYGLCEVIGPGVSFECLAARAEAAAGGPGGSHVNEDHFLVECVDPESGRAVHAGEVGELVFTTLTKQAMPLLRYRSGDLATLNHEPCGCGRTTVRMSRVLGRRDDMLVVRGVNVYPSEVEAVLLAAADLAPHYTLVLDTRTARPTLSVVAETLAQTDAEVRAERAGQLAGAVRERLGLSARVVLGPPGCVPRTEVGKAVRVLRRDAGSSGLPGGLAALLDGPG